MSDQIIPKPPESKLPRDQQWQFVFTFKDKAMIVVQRRYGYLAEHVMHDYLRDHGMEDRLHEMPQMRARIATDEFWLEEEQVLVLFPGKAPQIVPLLPAGEPELPAPTKPMEGKPAIGKPKALPKGKKK